MNLPRDVIAEDWRWAHARPSTARWGCTSGLFAYRHYFFTRRKNACRRLVMMRQFPFCFLGAGQRPNHIADEDDNHQRNRDKIHLKPATAALTGLTDYCRPIYQSVTP